MTCLLEWPTGFSIRLRDPRTSPFRLKDQRTSPLLLSDQQISASSPNLQNLYCLFKSHVEFVDFICKRKYLSLYPLVITYILRHPPFIFSTFFLCHLATALNLLSSSLPARILYYILTEEQKDDQIEICQELLYF